MDLILANQTYLELLLIIYAQMQAGKIPSQDLIDQARQYGHLAQVPEEELNALEVAKHHGATIH